MNAFLLSLTALLILVLGALFAAPLVVDWNDYRPVFEQQASKLLGREVKVGGKVHMVVLPAPELRFDDVKVADANGNIDRPLLAAKSFEAWLNIGALLTGAIEARKITITEPVLRLEVDADGRGNWGDVGRPGEAVPFAPKEVLLDSVDVTGGRIELAKDGALVLALDAVEGQASAASLAGPYKVSASYQFEGRRQELRFSTSAADPTGLFHVKSALRDLDRSTVYLLDGEVTGLGGKPAYDGNIVIRTSIAAAGEPAGQAPSAVASEPGQSGTDAKQADLPPDAVPPDAVPPDAVPGAGPPDTSSGLELKGEVHANAGRVELPAFELTVHAKAHPQILKGKLALDLGPQRHAEGELAARFVDVDTLLAAAGEQAASPAGVLNAIAEKLLGETASIGDGKLALNIEQLSLGGDLIGNLDLALATSGDGVQVEHLKAELPGQNHIQASGRLVRGETGPVFTGPVKLDGSKLKTLTRWAAGDRDMSGQASVGAFNFAADATIGNSKLKLDNVTGELSGTKFKGAFFYQGGDKSAVDVTLDSDRLDLKEIFGEDVAWRSWLPSAAGRRDAAAEPNLLAALRDDELHFTLRVGELLLPNIPPGKLDANFSLARDTLDVARLDFASEGSLNLTGKGRIDRLSDAPSGRVDFALKAANGDSLRVAGGLIGLPESLARSKHLGSLAPMDIAVSLTAAREGGATKASLDVSGKAGGSDVAIKGEARGEPGKLAEADINLTGTVSGERSQALLGLLLPDLAEAKLAALSGGEGRLSVELHGVPNTNVTGRVALETQALTIGFDGGVSLQDDRLTLTGKANAASPDAGIALMLLGLEASPGATGIPVKLQADLAKSASIVELKLIAGEIGGEPVSGSARFDLGGDKTRFSLDAKAGTVSLPVLLGSLVAWQRTPSTEELLGTIGSGGVEIWPARGFDLAPLESSEGEIKLAAKTLTLGAPFQVEDASLAARVDKDGLTISELQGRLFGGALAASGRLSPRAAGAELDARAELKGGRLDLLSKSVAGSVLIKGPFSLSFDVSGEGLSPPGLVAGLSGEGSLSLEPGVVQALSAEPMKRIAAEAAKTKKLKDKDQIAALTKTLRDRLTKGAYQYAAVTLPFEVKNGTLRLKPAALASKGAETTINGYVELASLRVDSEWELRLLANSDLPTVSLVFAGPLSNAGAIAPTIDTAAVETYLTMRRMQEDVERLETLDVSGKTPPPPPEPSAEPDAAAEPEPEPEPSAEAEAPSPPPEPKPKLAPPPAPPVARKETPAPRATDLEPKKEAAPVAAEPAPRPVPSAAKTETASPRAADLESNKETVAPSAEPALPWQSEQPPAAASVEPQSVPSAASGDAGGPSAAATGAEVSPLAAPVGPVTPKPRPHRPPPAPDDWKKGVGIFGGG